MARWDGYSHLVVGAEGIEGWSAATGGWTRGGVFDSAEDGIHYPHILDKLDALGVVVTAGSQRIL